MTALLTDRPSRWVALLAACAAACGSLPAWLGAQSELYCTVNKVTVETLTNAVRLTISADGVPQFEMDPEEYFTQEAGNWVPRRAKTIAFRLPNARTNLGSFVDVASYPVSHVQLAIPPESREGVGLDVTVSLYRAAMLSHVQVGDWHFSSGYGWEPPTFQLAESRDKRSIIVIVSSDRYREPGLQREEAAAGRSELTVRSEGDGLVSVHALNTPLGDILRAISETDGVDVVVRGGANYRASVSIERQTPALILRAIARGYGLSLRMVEGTYYVTEGLPTEVDSFWASATATFRLQHIPPALALDLLPDFLLRYVHVNADQNALVAAGPPQLLDKLESDLRALDQPLPQVELQALLVEEQRAGGLSLATNVVLASGLHRFSAGGGVRSLGYRLIDESMHDLQVRLHALQERRVVRTRVCPSVTVASGSRAELFLGRRHYFAFLSTASGEQEVTLTSTDVGSRIEAEPWTGDGETITIPLDVQANTLVSVDENGLPLVATREARGTVRIRSGDTIVFSGLTTGTADRRRRRGAVPILGELARQEGARAERSEALVLLSARAYTDVHQAQAKAQPS